MWTRDSLYVAPPNSTRAIETLPLNEIQAVVEMNDEPESNSKQLSFLNRKCSHKDDDDGSFRDSRPRSLVNRARTLHSDKKQDDDGMFREKENSPTAQDASLFSRNSTANCDLQVKTVVESVIAGRTLYLSTRLDHNPEQQRQAIVSTLCDAVAIARKKALVMSSFQKSQEKVRRVQSSLAFQIAMATLIILVSAR